MEKEYQQISRLKQEINHRLAVGTSCSDIDALFLSLGQDKVFQDLYSMDNQLIRLLHFLTIWKAEKQELPSLVIKEDIFYQVHSLTELEQKYRKIEYYCLRIENHVPEQYCRELMDQLMEQNVSGIAFGFITHYRTEHGQENLLAIAQELLRRMELPNAVLLLQFAREKYPDSDEFVLTEARCWIEANHPERACNLLEDLENPSPQVLELLKELRQVINNE